MTWKKFRDDSFRLTEKDVDKMIPHIVSQYKQAIKSIDEELKKLYNSLTGLNPRDYYTAVLKYERLDKLKTRISKEFAKYSKNVDKLIEQTGKMSFTNNYYRSLYGYNWLTNIDFALVPDELIEMSVNGTSSAWVKYQKNLKSIYGPGRNYTPKHGTLSNLLLFNRAKQIDNIQRAITQGLIQGQSYMKTSRDVRDIIGNVVSKNGVKSASGAMADAIRIVRTESNRIMNQAATANTERAKSEGIDVVRVWNAALDNRTRPEHARLDDKEENKNGYFDTSYGQVKGPGDFPTVGQNVNCRCTTFESIEGSRPSLRRGRNPLTGKNEVFDYKDFKQWATDNGLKTNKYGQYVPN